MSSIHLKTKAYCVHFLDTHTESFNYKQNAFGFFPLLDYFYIVGRLVLIATYIIPYDQCLQSGYSTQGNFTRLFTFNNYLFLLELFINLLNYYFLYFGTSNC